MLSVVCAVVLHVKNGFLTCCHAVVTIVFISIFICIFGIHAGSNSGLSNGSAARPRGCANSSVGDVLRGRPAHDAFAEVPGQQRSFLNVEDLVRVSQTSVRGYRTGGYEQERAGAVGGPVTYLGEREYSVFIVQEIESRSFDADARPRPAE